MNKKPTSKENMDRLRAALREGRNATDQPLLEKLERCRVDWGGRYRCRSPACTRCRWRHIRREQRITANWFGHCDNNDLAMVTVVLGSTREISEVGAMIASSRNATRKRVAACRRADPRWNGVYMTAWHEIDAVAANYVPLLPPQRRPLVEQIVPPAFDRIEPIWMPSYHGVVRLNGIPPAEVACAFRRNWKIDRQVDVRPFKLHRTVATNLAAITYYGNKFDCSISLEKYQKQTWALSWQTEFFGWLNTAQRNPFESLRMSVNPYTSKDTITDCDSVAELSAMPSVYSFTRVPMIYNTGGSA